MITNEQNDGPIDLVQFSSAEHHNFIASIANNTKELTVLGRIQDLYADALRKVEAKPEDMMVWNLFTMTHYHLLFSTSCLMRCHLSEAFSSVRVAIDAALVASMLILDRKSQTAYINRTKPFDKLIRHYKNLINSKRPLPHKNIPILIKYHGEISSFASHADVASFIHRTSVKEDHSRFYMLYFQYSADPIELSLHFMKLFQTFVAILDVFSPYLVNERMCVPDSWRERVLILGSAIEQHMSALAQAKQAAEKHPAP